ncbi:uncharacterized protein LOC129556233 [Moschus berezovskii]|uniref:uncharacterized protein LOC129556233 n=1 Tax=Moschus berezovskii TaxID=68408 RepID=UPI00244479E1|nr:uncharacterized protein LOC129556233 [Moschus berezovskii]
MAAKGLYLETANKASPIESRLGPRTHQREGRRHGRELAGARTDAGASDPRQPPRGRGAGAAFHRRGRGGASAPGLLGGRSGRPRLVSGRGTRRVAIGQGRKARTRRERLVTFPFPERLFCAAKTETVCLSKAVGPVIYVSTSDSAPRLTRGDPAPGLPVAAPRPRPPASPTPGASAGLRMLGPWRGPVSRSGGGAGCGLGGCGRRPAGRSVLREDPGKIRAVAGRLEEGEEREDVFLLWPHRGQQNNHWKSVSCLLFHLH